MEDDDVVIIGGARTPFCEWLGGKRGDGEPGGRLSSISAEELGTIAIKGALEKTGTETTTVLLKDSLSAALILPSEAPKNKLSLLMPIRIN